MRCWSMPVLCALARRVARMRQRNVLRLAGVLSVLAWPLLGKRRRIVATNLALCFPECNASARSALLRANQRSTLMNLLEWPRALLAPASAFDGIVRIEGLERLQAILATGQGVLLLGGHFLHPELAPRLLADALGRPVRAVLRRNRSECLERRVEAARVAAFGGSFAKKDVGGLLQALRAGEPVVTYADQDFRYRHAFVPFFGIPAATLLRTPELVRESGARMLPFRFHREPDGSYVLCIDDAWPGWMDGTPEESAAIYMRATEAAVRAHPEQYLWMHRRFKTRPPGDPPLYA